MKTHINSIFVDISFLLIIVLIFIGMIFFSIDNVNITFDCAMLLIVSIILIVTYFYSFKVSLILNGIFIVGLMSFALTKSINMGIVIPFRIYFWIIWSPLITLAFGLYVIRVQKINAENIILREQIRKFTTIDELTQMNNLLAFETDAKVYMSIARRYKMELTLVVWEIMNQSELEEIFEKERLNKMIVLISDAIKITLRNEDLVYFMGSDPYTWGVLLFTKPEAVNMVSQRVATKIKEVDLKKYTKNNIDLDLLTGIIQYDGKNMTPLAFLKQAKDSKAFIKT